MKIAIISDSHDNAPNIEKFIGWANGQTPRLPYALPCPFVPCVAGGRRKPIGGQASVSPLSKREGIGAVIHCGDICAPAIIKKFFGPMLSCPVHLIYGNVSDRDTLAKVVKDYDHITLHGDQGEIELAHKKIAFIHYPDEAKELAKSGKYDLVFYGHSHKPWDETIGKTRLLNPGTLAGLFQKATFATYDLKTGKADLILVEKL